MAHIVRTESHEPLIVTEWHPGQLQSAATAGQLPGSRVPPVIVGIVGTLLIHVIVLQSVVVLATGVRETAATTNYDPGSMSADTRAPPDQSLELMQPIAAPSVKNSFVRGFASRRTALLNQPITLIRPDATLPAPDIKIDSPDESKADANLATSEQASYARLSGIYSGQIQARVERLWRRPRTSISEPADRPTKAAPLDDAFTCQVQIVQDPHGNVQEVLLPHCNGSTAWQRSLVMAINQASPLPAPPDPGVFSPIVTLQFVGLPYARGSSPDEYEIPAPALTQSMSMD